MIKNLGPISSVKVHVGPISVHDSPIHRERLWALVILKWAPPRASPAYFYNAPTAMDLLAFFASPALVD
jgi:hypothetical protein